ncbi:MAG: SMC-Scp complex subunit ScpB [Ruminococcaceae bacterium]|nr:SMC-Scp complex subunit ScpB [Oscillospiraceae bacterium]
MNNQQVFDGIVDLEYIIKASEAVLFACGSAVGFDKLAFAVGAAQNDILPALEKLQKKYQENGSAIELVIYDGYAQLITKSEYGDIVRTALELRKNQPLSRAALEVLAIIAYNQPVTRAFIDRVRGVESPSVTAALAEKGLIEEVGRLDAPGHPILYGTTPVFLRTFGLESTAELENLPELEEIRKAFAAGEEQQQMDIGDGKLTEDNDPEGEINVPDVIPEEGVIEDLSDEGIQISIDDTEDTEE